MQKNQNLVKLSKISKTDFMPCGRQGPEFDLQQQKTKKQQNLPKNHNHYQDSKVWQKDRYTYQ